MRKKTIFNVVSGLICAILLSALPLSLAGQSDIHKVSGVVTDQNSVPLPGVTVSLTGTKVGTVTDSNGKYTIEIVGTATDILSFDCLGYKTVKEQVGGRPKVDVIMEESSEMLDELVVVGYGTIRKSDMVGSSAAMKADHIADMKTYSFEQAIQGRLAGVVVTSTSGEPGSAINMTVRGASSINGSNAPLFVIDGVPMDNISSASEYEGNSSFNVMSLVNPNDIASIEVLKDASSTAIYGSRGANGVVMVTTKQGSKGRAQVNLAVNHSINWSNKYFELINGQEYASFLNTGYKNVYPNSNSIIKELGRYYGNQYIPGSVEVGEGTDWQKAIRQVANSGNYSLSITGGSDKMTYFISGNVNDEEGIILKNDYNKFNIRANFNFNVKKWLDVKFTANAFHVNANRATTVTNQTAYTNVARNGAVFKSLWANPMLPIDHQAYLQDELVAMPEFGVCGVVNPYLDIMNETYRKKTYNLNLNMDMIFKITKRLTFTVRGNVVYWDDSNRRSWNDKSYNAWKQNGYYTDSSANTFKYGNENFFNYSTNIKGHSINAVLGMSMEKAQSESLYYDLQNYSVSFDEYEYKNGYATSVGYKALPTVGASERILVSAYGRINYSYRDRYLFNATLRADASSVFASKKKTAIFPSFGVGWNFTNEKFMENAGRVLTKGKIRYSYGTAGNCAISPYGSLASLSSVTRLDSEGNTFMGFRVGSHPENPYLTWETTAQHNLGLDLGLFNIVNLSLDVYEKTTSDLFQTITIPAQTGYTSYVGNLGSIRNRGIEVELGVNAFNTKDFFWDINATFTTNKGEILDLGSQDFIDYYAPVYGAQYKDPTHRLVKGGAIGDFYGLQTDGLLTAEDIEQGYPTYRNGNKPGKIKYVNQNPEEDDMITIEDDGVVLGNANPDFVIGFGSNIGYKGFTLSFMFNAAVGQEVMNLNRLFSEFGFWQVGVPTRAYYSDYWSEDNQDAYYPAPGDNSGMAICDRLIEDGSYLRLSNLTLRYDIPEFKKFRNFKASVFVTGTNLFVLSRYSGYDPELSTYGGNLLRAGIDQGVYPRSKSFTFGIDLTF